jgi:hypothetical protein
MKTPCKMCTNYSEIKVGFRKFVGCNDKEKEKGFNEDTRMYHHTCTNQTIREECKKCIHNRGMYCNSVISFVDGKCIDRKEVAHED